MLPIGKGIVIALSLLLCISCGSGDEGVWDQYDYTEHNPYYPQTEDNDDTYIPPSELGSCDGFNLIGCE